MSSLNVMEGRSAEPHPEAGAFAIHTIDPITNKEFALFQTFVRREAGINLSEAKRALLVGRLSSRLRKLGLKSFLSYYRHMQADAQERVLMFDALATNETHFFREPRQFEFLEQRVFPEWRELPMGARRIRIWSAGCSTGEEPYSLAMSLLDHFPPGSGFSFEIFATDISTKVLERARTAVWPIHKSTEIPPAYRKSFMLKGEGPEDGKMMAGRALRDLIRFERLNFQDEAWKVPGDFHLIFCRNVLIYFDAEGRARVVRRLLERLSPAGYFFLGHSESLDPAVYPVLRAGPMVYAHASHSPVLSGSLSA